MTNTNKPRYGSDMNQTLPEAIGATLGAALVAVIVAVIVVVPNAWLVMLAAGNLGFAQFGLIDCLPVGAIIGMFSASCTTAGK